MLVIIILTQKNKRNFRCSYLTHKRFVIHTMVEAHPFAQTQVSDFQVDDRTYKYFSLPALGEERYAKLPYSIRVLLESAVRNCDNFNVKSK